MRLVTGTVTRILVDLTFEFDPSAATVQVELDDDGVLLPATWVGPAVEDTAGGTWSRTAQTDGTFIAGPVADPAPYVELDLGRHFTTAHITAGTDSFVTPATVIDVVNELRSVTVGELRDHLTNAGGAGARTAGQLSDERLAVKLEEATAETLGRLGAFTIAPGAAPPLLRTIILGIGAYLATLEYFGSQALEERDPMVLGYARAEKLLGEIAKGILTVAGITLTSGTVASGDAAVYGGADVGLASGWMDGMYDGRHNSPAHSGGVTWE